MLVDTESNTITDARFFSFCAKVGDTSIVFTVDQQDNMQSKQHALHAAKSLSALESEIEFVENLFSQKLEFNPIEKSTEKDSLSLCGISCEGAGLVIDLPWEKMKSTDFSNGIEIPDGLEWQGVSSLITVSRLSLNPEDLNTLQNDSILLLPESFSSDWRTEINIESMDRKLCGIFDPDKQVCHLTDDCLPGVETVSSSDAPEAVSVCLSESVLLSPDSLLNTKSFNLPANITEMNWLVVTDNGVLAHGQPVKIGGGYGLSITRALQ